MPASIIAVANQKGGVGKTTTCVNLGASLTKFDKRVLIIDLDPQANASTGLGVDPKKIDHSMYHVLLADKSLDSILAATALPQLLIAPSSLDLAGAEIELFSAYMREQRLRNALDNLKEEFDYIFIDCPPTLGLLTVNAFTAAKEVLLPIQCEYYALEGVAQLVGAMMEMKKHLNADLEVTSVVLVMFDSRTKLSKQVEEEVRRAFEDQVFENVVPRSVQLAEAPAQGLPITLTAPSSRGAQAYIRVAEEFIQRRETK